MNILKLKRILYLFITVAVVGLLATSCEREIIGGDQEGFKQIIIEDDLVGAKVKDSKSANFKKGDKALYLHFELLNVYYNYATSNKKLTKEERIKIIDEVTYKDLYNCPPCAPLIEDGVYSYTRQFLLASTPCVSNDGEYNVTCSCSSQLCTHFLNLRETWLSNKTYQNCINMAIAQCNWKIAVANCDGEGPIESCEQYYEVCYDEEDDDGDNCPCNDCPCPPNTFCINGNCLTITTAD